MDRGKLKILIADDEEGLRFSMGGILELEGYEIVTVGNGLEAIEKARTDSFDIAFLDIKMPGINGVETFKEIKRISPETVVIMMTAFAVKDLIKEALDEGAYACINKPFDMDRIIDTVKEVSRKPFVVVIDDDPHLCNLVHDRFKENGCNVVTRSSGLEGIKLVSRKMPDVVFLDIVMGGMDGITTLKKLKDLLGPDCPKTVIMSAHDRKSDFEEAKRLGATICLRKPLDFVSLRKTIVKMTGKDPRPKICVVDNDRAACEALKDILMRNGYEVEVACSGTAVVEKSKNDAFGILILDLRLPDANGIDVYERIKKMNANVSAIFVSSSYDESALEIIKKNRYIYLHKPFEPADLIKMIEQLRDSGNQ